MNPNNQNAFAPEPGRIITRREPYRAPITGRLVEIQWLTISICDQGVFRTEDVQDAPALDDGRVPESASQIQECSHCFSLVHVDNSYVCPVCGRTFCLSCTVQIEVESQQVKVCTCCAKEAKSPALFRIIKKAIWG